MHLTRSYNMALYKLTLLKDGSVGGVFSDELRKAIPKDSYNADWIDYLEWVAEGNTPEPADSAGA